MTLPTVVMCSLWRNDLSRRLVDRVEHLLAKNETYPALRWVWVVGDSTDDTTRALADLSYGYPVQIVDIGDTGIEGDDHPSRLRRLSETANEWWNWIDPSDDFVMVHESDLISPPDIVNRFVSHAQSGHCPIAGWPTLEIRPGVVWFYDTLCYVKDGQRFTNQPPYHACYRPDELFEVDSFGSVYMFAAEDVPFVRFIDNAVLNLCAQLKERGRTLMVDPQLTIVQPHDLWEYFYAP